VSGEVCEGEDMCERGGVCEGEDLCERGCVCERGGKNLPVILTFTLT
jgi:hypothetical protein